MARRGNRRPLEVWGRSKPRIAMQETICVACNEKIAVGELLCFDSVPWPKARYHAECESVKVAHPAHERGKPEAPEAPEARDESYDAPAPRGGIEALIAAIVDERVQAQLEGYQPPAGISRETVQEMLRDLVRPEVTIVIKRPDLPDTKLDGEHYLFPRLVRLVSAGFHVYLWGPAGSGKTTAAEHVATALGREFELGTLDATTSRTMVLGYRTPAGEPVGTDFTRAYGEGKVLIQDELDCAPGSVQNLYNSALANGKAPAAWGMLTRHDHFSFIGTGNTPGRQIPGFTDRKNMSEAFKDRLYFVHWPIDPAIEARACGLDIPDAPERDESWTCTPRMWGQWVMAVRDYCAEHAPTVKVTPRATLDGLRALAIGETPEEIAHALVFKGADKILTNKVLAAHPLPRS